MAGKKEILTVRADMTGIRALLAQLNELPKQASQDVRVAAGVIAEKLVPAAKRGAITHGGPQGKLLAPTIKVVRDRVPSLQAGGTKRVGSNKVYAYKVLYGSEFGSTVYKQFHHGHTTDGYWFFPLIRTEDPMIEREMSTAIEAIIARFNSEG